MFKNAYTHNVVQNHIFFRSGLAFIDSIIPSQPYKRSSKPNHCQLITCTHEFWAANSIFSILDELIIIHPIVRNLVRPTGRNDAPPSKQHTSFLTGEFLDTSFRRASIPDFTPSTSPVSTRLWQLQNANARKKDGRATHLSKAYPPIRVIHPWHSMQEGSGKPGKSCCATVPFWAVTQSVW